jgi:uncharacterized protein YggE
MKVSLALALILSLTASIALAQTDRTITVLSTGTATAVADRAQLQLTVSSMDQTAVALFVKQKDVVSRLKNALVKAGVKANDISESPIRLLPNYEYGQAGTRIIGYRAETPMTVDVSDMAGLAQLIDLAASSGASMVSLGSFTKSGSGSLHDEALKDALEGARKEAATLAKEMGRSVGDILSITQVEDASGAPRGGGREEEEERERAKMSRDQNAQNTLTEKAELRVVFGVK